MKDRVMDAGKHIRDADLELLRCVVQPRHRRPYPYNAESSIAKDSNKSLSRSGKHHNIYPLTIATFVIWPVRDLERLLGHRAV